MRISTACRASSTVPGKSSLPAPFSFFTRRLVMTGDTDLGLVVKNAPDAIDWPRLPLPRL